MGGTAALVVGARDGNVEAVVAISAPERFEEQDALAAVAASDVPVLLLASEEDTAAILSLDELLAAARGPVESAVYAGNAHGTDLFEGEHAVPARERIFLFLEELGGP
jgi:dienelactone hydrolase